MSNFFDTNFQANDFCLMCSPDGYYDLAIENGQFKQVYNFDTALLISIFGERRADASEVKLPQHRSGWWGNLILFDDGFEMGSKIWILNQKRLTQDVLNMAVAYAYECTEWLIQDRHVKDIFVTGSFTDDKYGLPSGITLQIDLTTWNDEVESKYYTLWNNTGRTDIIVDEIDRGLIAFVEEDGNTGVLLIDDETNEKLAISERE